MGTGKVTTGPGAGTRESGTMETGARSGKVVVALGVNTNGSSIGRGSSRHPGWEAAETETAPRKTLRKSGETADAFSLPL